MLKNLKLLFAAAAISTLGFAANAATVNLDFPTEAAIDSTSTMGDATTTGYFFFLGHSVEETFADTGLSSVDFVSLTLDLTFNSLKESIGLGISLNGTQFGTIYFNPGDALGTYAFGIGGSTANGINGDDYTVSLFVDDPVGLGKGSVQFSTVYSGGLELQGPAVSEVPLPASLPLLLVGLGAVYGLNRKKKA